MITVIANLKGGSGKSTITFNLAIWLKMKGKEVFAYDLDPQKTLNDVAHVRKVEGIEPCLEVNLIDLHNVVHFLNRHSGDVLVDVGAGNMYAMNSAISVADRVLILVQPSQPDLLTTQRFRQFVSTAWNS